MIFLIIVANGSFLGTLICAKAQNNAFGLILTCMSQHKQILFSFFRNFFSLHESKCNVLTTQRVHMKRLAVLVRDGNFHGWVRN